MVKTMKMNLDECSYVKVSKLILMDGCPTWAGNSVSHAIQTDFKRLVLAANEKRTAIDNESVQRYLLLGDAIASYIPRDHFYGDTVLLQAKAKSDLSALIPNEDYNVSLVRFASKLQYSILIVQFGKVNCIIMLLLPSWLHYQIVYLFSTAEEQ